MLKLKNMRISHRLTAGFSAVALLVVLLGAFSVFSIYRVGSVVENLYKHPFTVSNAVLRIKVNIYDIHRNMKDLALVENQQDFERYRLNVDRIERDTLKEFELVEDRFLGDLNEVETARRLFEDWAVVRSGVIELSRKGQYRKASEMTRGEGAVHVEKLEASMNSLIDFASRKAETFRQEAGEDVRKTGRVLLMILLLVLIVSVIAGIVITVSIRVPLEIILQGIVRIETGDLMYDIPVRQKDEIGRLADTFRDLQENLKYKSSVLDRIASGDFSEEVSARSPKDSLAHSINLIVENFSIVVEQANAVSAGDFRAELTVRSDKNELGQAILRMKENLLDVVEVASRVADHDYSITLEPKSDKDELSEKLNTMTRRLKELSLAGDEQNWLKSGQAELSESLQGEKDPESICRDVVGFLTPYLNAQVGCIYLHDSNGFRLAGSHAFTRRKSSKLRWDSGEGLVGQAAAEQKMMVIEELPEDYMALSSGTGSCVPRNLAILPCVMNGRTMAVIEIASLKPFDAISLDLLESVGNNIAISIVTAEARAQTLAQSEILKQQQDELRASNEELEVQARKLQASEEELKAQQEELMATNTELEEKTRNLEEQKDVISQSNRELERAGKDLELKARELELSSKYKSEFLANMSHELRTPLNSLLILAQDLKENRDGNLSENQLQSADVIYKSGNDLLKLINEILDLSKIEAGKMDVTVEDVELPDLLDMVVMNFKRFADEKGLLLTTHMDENAPTRIRSDRQRLDQIVRNLVSNAMKFTEEGAVSCTIDDAEFQGAPAVRIQVKDTGIGIPEEKYRHIFEAFQQVDGSISRKYGGTGLGLSIVRELVRLLGGDISLESEVGRGTTISVSLPREIAGSESAAAGKDSNGQLVKVQNTIFQAPLQDVVHAHRIADDHGELKDGDLSILVVEDDARFAELIREFCHSKNMKFIHAGSGEQGLELAEEIKPSGIILDIKLPGINGWDVLERLKNNTSTRHIPVHMMSAMEESVDDAFRKGAIGYLSKPATRDSLAESFNRIENLISKTMQTILLVEDNVAMRMGIRQLIADDHVRIVEVDSGAQAIQKIENELFDCMILDLGLPDMTGYELLKKVEESRKIMEIPPVIVYTGKELTREQEEELEHYASSIIIKGVKSRERLLDETALFLHKVVADMPEQKRDIIRKLYNRDSQFDGKKILLVDDDMRNVFALTKILEDNKMQVIKAVNGQKALDILQVHSDIDLVLMDLMMPVMDGFEATRRIRQDERFRKLPIIAVTAKAMKEDREKCFEAGANDYIAKPVNVDRLLSLMRLWLYK